ncbi:tyrosinase-like isoform X2, partial [Paramuricea clavata]
MIKNLVPRTLWFVLVNIVVLAIIEGSNPTKNPYNITPEELCTFDEQLGTNECPSLGECECIEKRAFEMRSREFEGNIIKHKDLAAESPCEHRIRRDIMTLSREERRRYIHAVKAIRTDPRTSKRFYDFGHLHVDYFCKVLHCTVFFLPWHRWFILQYKNFLREIEPNVTLVYWDWSMVMVNPFDVNLWDDNEWSFGGDGDGVNHTVITGPFKEPEWQMVPSYGPDAALQLRRYLNYTYPGPADAVYAGDSLFTQRSRGSEIPRRKRMCNISEISKRLDTQNAQKSLDGKNIKFESKSIWKRVFLAQSCPEQPMLQAHEGVPD